LSVELPGPAASSELRAIWQQPEFVTIVAALHPLGVYLVGGAVRDLLLKRPVKDFDFLVDCEPDQLLALKPQIKAATGSTVIVLDGERGILRVCQRDSEGLDLAARQGPTVEKDLARRDVTFNAMALASDGTLLDPFGGSTDLASGLVKVTSPGVLQDDPLRVLRCLRLAATLHFTLDAGTRSQLAQHAPGLSRVAGERIGEELQRFLAYAGWDLMEEYRQAAICTAIWGEKAAVWGAGESRIPWDWLEQWWTARPEQEWLPRPPTTVLSILGALLSPFPLDQPKLMERLKLSKAQSKYLTAWWAGLSSLRERHPSTRREVFHLLKLAGESLDGLLSFAVLPGLAEPASPRDPGRSPSGDLGGNLSQAGTSLGPAESFTRPVSEELAERLRKAASGEGELRLDPLPLGGEELCRHWDREPGPWLGVALRELAAVWACREENDVDGLLNRRA
jgi:tRNA nucleotidyltransferase/poly(A) polymerase